MAAAQRHAQQNLLASSADVQPNRTLPTSRLACWLAGQLKSAGHVVQIVTSARLPEWDNWVTIVASTTLPQQQGPSHQQLRLRVPRVDAYFTGTGGQAGCAPGSSS
jgi:hypothetical protein